jgi:alkaline phosphatase
MVVLCLLSVVAFAAGNAKYVFLFIGDGMATPQIAAAEAFLGEATENVDVQQLNFTQFPIQAMTTTYAADRFITGSAAAGTALACGYKTNIGVISMDPGKTVEYKTIAEMAKEAGMKIGIVSSVDIDHATPAAFYAHAPSRSQYYEIGLQMVSSNFDYFGGGRVRLSKTPEGEPTVLEVMAENGWTIAENRSEFSGLKAGDSKVYAYNYGFASDALKYAVDREANDITLAEFTEKGIELLDNPNGFFMMVEGGKIDWACHANDAGASIHDTIAFDDAVAEAIEFYNEHPDETLIIVTGDHECGGLTLGFAGTAYESAFGDLANQAVSYEWFNKYMLDPYKESADTGTAQFADLEDEIAEYFGMTDLSDYERQRLEDAFAQSMAGYSYKSADTGTFLLYGSYEPLTVTITHLLNQRAGLAWTSYSHTGIPVPTFALGVGQDLFGGYYDNTDIFWKMVETMGLGAMALQ